MAFDQKQAVIDFLTGFTAETTPKSADKVSDFNAHLRPNTKVYVTFLPGSDFADTIRVCKRLRSEGFDPIPHFAARSIPSRAQFEENLKSVIGEAGIDKVLLIAGGVDSPLGEFSDTMQLMETGLLDQNGIKSIGVAGHPEGSPDMSDQAIRDALLWKNSFSERTDAEMYVVTQFCFEAEPVIAWDKKIQMEGNKLPIYIGIPGLATIKTLLMLAKASGVGPSMRFLTRQARNVAKLLVVSTPDKQTLALANYKASDPNCGIAGVHMYPLGGLKRTALWTYGVLDGKFDIDTKSEGFKVNVDI